MAAAAEIVLSPLLQVVFEKLASRVLKKIAVRCGFSDEIQKLQRGLRMIQAVLEDAEERQATDKTLKLWLTELKEVAYDIDDLLEESTQEFMLQLHGNNETTFAEQVNNILSSAKPFMTFLRKLPDLKLIRERLDVLLDERSCFNLRDRVDDKDIMKRAQKRETGSFVIESEVIGREEDKEKIIQMLVSTTDRRVHKVVSIIPVVGLGDIGKTTLAQTVYNDERVMRNFELRMWVSVNDDFSVRKIVSLMIESATRRRCDDLLGMDSLQFQLRDLLFGKRYLLVLDDVWNEDEDEWDKLKMLLKFGAEESKVIVTTRSAKVAAITGTISSYHLKGLSDDDCWTLFKQRAFAHGQEVYPNLVQIGKQIAKKCGGVPLASKTLGSLMRFKREPGEWLHVQESDLWNVCEEENGILAVLRLSYSHLPSHLKGCFMYCSIFPKNYVIKKDKLIQLWIAEGLIQQTEERKPLEDIASEYFNDLMWMLFFEDVKKNDVGEVTECKMHDLLHDLAKSVAGEEYFVSERGLISRNLAKLRYLSVVCDSRSCTIPEALYEAKKLRTLLLLYPKGDLGEVPTKLFSSFRCLRVLDLGNCGIKRVQSTISCLKYLRYLNLSNAFIEILPESLCSLLNLQVLDLSGCSDLIDLPRSLTRLSMLRHLLIYGCERLTRLPGGIYRLQHLQTLPLFIVANESNNPSEGALLRELSRLPLLKGELTIRKLENVRHAFVVAYANISEKSLHSVELSWGDDHEGLNLNVNNDLFCQMGETVLGSLRPPQNLKSLSLKGYPGICFPRWLSTLGVPGLTKLELINCKRCEKLPTLGKLPFLEIIHMRGMHAVKNIGSEFYGADTRRLFGSLKELTLIDFPDLEHWWSISGGNEFPSLVKLTINKCPKLMNMPQLPSVKHLELRNCHETLLWSLVNVSSLSTLVVDVFTGHLILLDNLLQKNIHLTSLTISSCPNLRCIPPSLGNLVSLKSLAIRWCENLLYLPRQLQNLTSLQSLEISECHSLSALPQRIDGLISLKYLSIENCSNLRSLQIGLNHLSSLEHLTIMYCPNLVALPTEWHNLSMLRSLCILRCPELSSLPDSIKHVTTLQNLEFHDCSGLSVLPEWIANLSLLRSLAISDCPNITSIPEGLQHLSTLQRLSIQGCPRLEEHCKKSTGKDWPKIAHIPHIYIGSPELKRENVASSSGR